MSGVQFGDSGMPPGVKVVKLSATTTGIANARTVYSPQVSEFSKMPATTTMSSSIVKYKYVRLSNSRLLVESSMPKNSRVRVGYANMRTLGHSL